MLPKKNRADKKAIDGIFQRGRIIGSDILAFRFIRTNSNNNPRISFIAPKIISKKAVKRNSLRRRGYTALKKYIKNFPLGLVGVFIFKKPQDDGFILENEIKNILNKIN